MLACWNARVFVVRLVHTDRAALLVEAYHAYDEGIEIEIEIERGRKGAGYVCNFIMSVVFCARLWWFVDLCFVSYK